MDKAQLGAGHESWRVVVFTNIPGGIVYRLAEEVLSPLGHRIVGVLTSPGPKGRPNADYLEVVAAVPPGVDVLVSNHPGRWAAMLAPLRPDLIICGGMPWRIPSEVLALPRLGAINLHPALLPRYRGPAAIEWAFRNGDPETGSTVHRMAPDFDTGPILAQMHIPIDDEDDLDALVAKLVPAFPELLRQALERVARGDPGEPQDESEASHAGFFEDAWRTIDWTRPARTIHNQVRSWTGGRTVPRGAFGEVEGEVLRVVRTRLLPADGHAEESAPPGSVLRRDGEAIILQCGDGPLELVTWNRLGSGHGPDPSGSA